MGRLWAGLLIATGFHLLLFTTPVYRSSLEPLSPQAAKTITVRLNTLEPTPPLKEENVSSPLKPIISSIKEIEKSPPPIPKPAAVTPKPKPRKIVKKKKATVKPPKPTPPLKPEVIQEQPDPNKALKPLVESAPIVQPPTSKEPPVAEKSDPSVTMNNQMPIPIRKAYPKNEGNPPPKYPMLARRRGWEGTVQLSVLVLENGQVGDISVVKSSGHPLLDTTALKTVAKYHFVPGQRGNQMVAMRVKVPVHFQLQNVD